MLEHFEVIIPIVGHLSYWQTLKLLFRHFYVVILNLKYLGTPSQPIMAFLASAYQQVFGRNFPLSYAIFYRLFGKRLICLHNYQGQKVGFALFRVGPVTNIHLTSMGILASYRGRGLSKVFLNTCLISWKKAGFVSSSLFVEERNLIAQKAYKSLGYQEIRNIDDMLFMAKLL